MINGIIYHYQCLDIIMFIVSIVIIIIYELKNGCKSVKCIVAKLIIVMESF